jgi:hypothetical protein
MAEHLILTAAVGINQLKAVVTTTTAAAIVLT